jgi:uncharacterized cupin superfamily protein
MGELIQLATAAGKTGFFGAKSPEQALLVMMSGRDLGLSYAQSLRAFHVIESKPCLSADGMVAVVLVRRDVCEYFKTASVTNDAATVETKRVGQEAQRYTFSMADARTAGVAGRGNWQRFPSRMLLARARAALARDVYPDLLLGLYDPDEIGSEPAQRADTEATVVASPTPTPAAVAARAVVDAAPKVVATQHEGNQGDAAIIEAFVARFAACRTGEEVNSVVAGVVKARPAGGRAQLAKAHKDAKAAVEAIEKAPAFGGFDEEREAMQAESALGGGK